MAKKVKIMVKLLDDGDFAVKIKKNYKEETSFTIMQMITILELTKNSYLSKIGEKNGN